MNISRTATMGSFVLASLLHTQSVLGAEGGMGDYALGLMGPQAGYLPDPGSYVKVDSWTYSADARVSGGKPLPCCTGSLTASADIKASLDMQANILTALHVFGQPVLGGHAAIAPVLPYVDADVDLQGVATLSDNDPYGRRISVAGKKMLSDENLGDSILGGLVGWHDGRLHYTAGVNLYMPTGHYDEGEAVNTGRNYWAIEPNAAFTYLNESNGLEFSSALGLTINRENDYTDQTGSSGQSSAVSITSMARC